MRCFLVCLLAGGCAPSFVFAQGELPAALQAFQGSDYLAAGVGVTRKGTPIYGAVSAADLDHHTSKIRVLLVGGLDGSRTSVDLVTAAAKLSAKQVALSFVPNANPDGVKAGTPENGSGGNPTRGYPPQGNAYNSKTDPEAAYLWRWIGMHAPDLVIVVRQGDATAWRIPAGNNAFQKLAAELQAQPLAEKDSLAAALVKLPPCNTGTVPAWVLETKANDPQPIARLLAALDKLEAAPVSPARKELQRRLARTPLQVATQLSQRYGHNLGSVVYIPAVALIGRIELGELTQDPAHLADVRKIVAPYLADKPSLPARPGGSHLSGHLIFARLAGATDEPRYAGLAEAAANLGFDAEGNPRTSMPAHSEMSDAVFMGCPILAEAGRLTGDAKYYRMCGTQLKFMQKLCLRKDGLYRHSPLDEAAWGRGNGFPALGLALSLSAMPAEFAGRDEILKSFQAHLEALSRHQDPTGMWHQVIDHPESYRELTSTSMITFAMTRGVLRGWLDRETYAPRIERAWYALRTRIGPDGTLVDVCTGTGKQKTLRDYYDRTAILGADGRGGAMALLVATELIRWERAGK